jgi:hypothetical protein
MEQKTAEDGTQFAIQMSRIMGVNSPEIWTYSGGRKNGFADGRGAYQRTLPDTPSLKFSGTGTFSKGHPIGSHGTEVISSTGTRFTNKVTYDNQGNHLNTERVSGSVFADILKGVPSAGQSLAASQPRRSGGSSSSGSPYTLEALGKPNPGDTQPGRYSDWWYDKNGNQVYPESGTMEKWKIRSKSNAGGQNWVD